ncbi:MAG: SMC family ATPase [Anaerolineae bacterium]|nr:SMC family ATPase [Anaerolineae bacterium]
MIPIRLKLSGFLSYRDPVEVDFSGFSMACISGQNGAGKSSILDAITYALFGQARKTGEALIHSNSEAAEVALTFEYEGNQYRIQRILPRGKSTTLEFQVWDGERWRPLTERSTRETQAKIEQTLRLDYETFVNASFFLQGKADQFTQQRSGDRKRILASILGLDQWDTYRERTAERRKTLEREVDLVDGRLAEINAELSEEPDRKARLAELETQLKEMATVRKVQENALETARRMAAALAQERKLTETLAAALERSRANRAALSARLADKGSEREAQADLVKRAAEVESAYRAWTEARAALEAFETAAAQFREQEKRRQPFLDEINSERARLEQERVALSEQFSITSNQLLVIDELGKEQERAAASLAEAEERTRQREELRARLDASRQRQAALKAENDGLKAQMMAMDERIKNLEVTESGNCPLCGQELSPEHRAMTIDGLKSEGRVFGDQWRANRVETESITGQVAELEAQVRGLSDAETERVRLAAQLSALSERLETARQAAAAWEAGGKIRLQEVEGQLNGEKFAASARSQLSTLDEELSGLGYDAAAHDAARQNELAGRESEAEYRNLEAARAALKPLENEIASLQEQLSTLNVELDNAEDAYAEAAARLGEAEANTPDLEESEQALFDLQERENRMNMEVGGARQLVSVLDSRRSQKAQYTARREELAGEIARHKTLERAFGKDGVPALLIEQALPQIEEKANELLDRLSNGGMSVRFVTQASYKDKKRDDLKETLDIVISDSAGERDYEMFSGGEAFRVNFAIRLALSEILAQRTGARLQTLVIDEGFGSQDAQGVQRLIEAINTVRGDFAKILIITHLDELKDAFPNRIEVEKGDRGSVVRVI